ncbi:MAG TPA: hypothetical protein PLY87_17745 [Planctomycetaceae bacterium]|nr:hypothetical protein [Planctomycetaceae bacterium]
MNSVFSTFLDRLAERFTAILASVVSSRVESLRAEVQAEQQSQLEDLARKYEADGKSSIAQALRERALRLTTGNLAGDGANVIDLVSAEPLRITGPNTSLNGGPLESLPDFSSPPKPEKKSRRRKTDAAIPSQAPDASGAEA